MTVTDSQAMAIGNIIAPAHLACEVLGFDDIAMLPVVAAQWLAARGEQYWTDYPAVSDYDFANLLPHLHLSSEGAGIAGYCYTVLTTPAVYTAFVTDGRAGNTSAALNDLVAIIGQSATTAYQTLMSNLVETTVATATPAATTAATTATPAATTATPATTTTTATPATTTTTATPATTTATPAATTATPAATTTTATPAATTATPATTTIPSVVSQIESLIKSMGNDKGIIAAVESILKDVGKEALANPTVAAEIAKDGQTLWDIATAHGLSVETLKALNPELSMLLKAGEKVILPS